MPEEAVDSDGVDIGESTEALEEHLTRGGSLLDPTALKLLRTLSGTPKPTPRRSRPQAADDAAHRGSGGAAHRESGLRERRQRSDESVEAAAPRLLTAEKRYSRVRLGNVAGSGSDASNSPKKATIAGSPEPDWDLLVAASESVPPPPQQSSFRMLEKDDLPSPTSRRNRGANAQWTRMATTPLEGAGGGGAADGGAAVGRMDSMRKLSESVEDVTWCKMVSPEEDDAEDLEYLMLEVMPKIPQETAEKILHALQKRQLQLSRREEEVFQREQLLRCSNDEELLKREVELMNSIWKIEKDSVRTDSDFSRYATDVAHPSPAVPHAQSQPEPEPIGGMATSSLSLPQLSPKNGLEAAPAEALCMEGLWVCITGGTLCGVGICRWLEDKFNQLSGGRQQACGCRSGSPAAASAQRFWSRERQERGSLRSATSSGSLR
eukprot:TRINITY_DN15969_c0_g1_i1.p1 TRINITY_DN15969_c0_g1~~TRINITY_DN15969_c0_g1_i1.p1  ORF type:complete len:435 (+),score=103.55 TRINITY_DN15969_c0_g1_i1:150-1454(+)